MASTFPLILDAIVGLLQGSAGTTRVIASGRYRHLDSTAYLSVNEAVGRPRPFYFGEASQIEDESQPSDVAGNYWHTAREFEIVIAYASQPTQAYSLQKEIAEDAAEICRVLLWPINWTSVDNWQGTEVDCSTGTFLQDFEDGTEEEIGKTLIVTVRVFYREDLS